MQTSFLARSIVGEGLSSASWTRGVLMLGVVLLLSFTAKADQPREHEFDIPQQGIETALSTLATQAGALLLFPYDLVQPVDSKPVSGRYTVEDALAILLEGTGLTGGLTEGGVITISRAGAVDNQGRTTMVQNDNKLNGSKAPTKRRGVLGVLAVVFSAGVGAQDVADVGEEEVRIDEIVVTGTNIRGIAPESSPTIIFDRDDIDRSGFLTTDEFIRSIPQNFGGGANNVTPFGVPPGAAGDIESNSNNVLAAGVNIRGLGAGSTLTLLNGRRISPAGSSGAFVDISSIPVSAIDRVEILTDGASSIYGGDAVAGVANFVLRADFEGAETSLSYGRTTEGNRAEFRVNQLLGTSWRGGSGFVSYEYLNQDILFGDDKGFSIVAPDPLSLLPGQKRHSVIGNLRQELSPKLEFNLTGYYADRFSESIFNRDPDDLPVQFEDADTEQFLIAPSLTYDLTDSWRVVLAGDYSETRGESIRSDLDKLTGVREEPTSNNNESSQGSFDLIADGSPFSISGGEIKVAFGGGYRQEDVIFFGTSGRIVGDGQRDVWAGFGELFIPVFSDQNAAPLVRRLELSVSIRYDDYSDFGASTNPKFGLLWSPVEGLSLRGSYSTSFNPPDLGLIGNPDTGVFFLPADNPQTGEQDLELLWLVGNNVNDIGPEESEAFTAGFDYTVDAFGGDVSVASSYYNIEFDERIGAVPTPFGFNVQNALLFQDQLPADSFTFNPSRSDVDFLVSLANASGRGARDLIELFNGMPADLDNLDFVYDSRIRNLATTKTEGVDFDVKYSRDLGSGELALGVAGDYIIDFTNQAASTAPIIEAFNRAFNPVDFRARGSLSWSSDTFTVTAFVNYTDGYTNDRVDPFTSVDSWTTIDLNLGYRFVDGGGSEILDGARLALSVRNLLDQDPPFIESDNLFSVSFFDGTNANPLGRFVSINFTKSW